MEKKNVSLITVCDLSIAFDRVKSRYTAEEIFMFKDLLFWFHNCLIDRTQSVCIKVYMSNKISIPYGVPQQSVLGSILCTTYVNDLPHAFSDCQVIQYADDAQFIHAGDINDILGLMNRGEECRSKAKLCFNKNGPFSNAKKTQCMFVGTRGIMSRIPADMHILVNGNPIFPSNTIKKKKKKKTSASTFIPTSSLTLTSWN